MQKNQSVKGSLGHILQFIKKYANFLLFAAVALITVYVLRTQLDFSEFLKILSEANYLYLGMGMLFMGIYWLMEAWMLMRLIRTEYPNESFLKAFSIAMIGQYYNLITPGASGGQPLQLIEMGVQGISAGFGTAVLVQKYMLYQVSVTLVGVLGCILHMATILSWSASSLWLIIFGLTINVAGSLLVLLVAFKPDIARVILNGLVRFGLFIHLLHRSELWYGRVDHFVSEYSLAVKAMEKGKSQMKLLFLVNFFAIIVYFAITYWIYRALGLNDLSFFEIISFQAVLYLVYTFIPLPGGSGGAEIGFSLIFGPVFSAFAPVAMVIWRFITFYFVLIFCGIYIGIYSLVGQFHTQKRKKT